MIADSAAMRISQASASASPAPAAGPGRLSHGHQRAGQGALLHLQVGNALLDWYFGFGRVIPHALDIASGAKGIAGA